LHTDASDYGIGANLIQVRDNQELPISFGIDLQKFYHMMNKKVSTSSVKPFYEMSNIFDWTMKLTISYLKSIVQKKVMWE
jgi:hypothetical protein